MLLKCKASGFVLTRTMAVGGESWSEWLDKGLDGGGTAKKMGMTASGVSTRTVVPNFFQKRPLLARIVLATPSRS